jgi:hypothetical protein
MLRAGCFEDSLGGSLATMGRKGEKMKWKGAQAWNVVMFSFFFFSLFFNFFLDPGRWFWGC